MLVYGGPCGHSWKHAFLLEKCTPMGRSLLALNLLLNVTILKETQKVQLPPTKYVHKLLGLRFYSENNYPFSRYFMNIPKWGFMVSMKPTV